MNFRNHLLVLVVTIGWLEGTTGAAFSNVIVRRDGIPVDYFTYDPMSLSFGSPQAAQLSTSPLESTSAIVTPCLAPCIIPNTGSQGLVPISSTSNAKIITYNPADPNVPVVTNKEAPRGYHYAYAVYDDHTGDKKSQSEQSDGSLVQGQYSFIQPDGNRREVIYTADDLKGFNAVVRNYAPEPEQPKVNTQEVVKPEPAPCPEPQNAQLTKNYDQSKERAIQEVENLQEPERELKSVHKSGDINREQIENKVVKNPEEATAKAQPREGEPRLSGEAIETPVTVLTSLISYNDIIKCLQAKLISANSAVSPLTYILIPSLKGLC